MIESVNRPDDRSYLYECNWCPRVQGKVDERGEVGWWFREREEHFVRIEGIWCCKFMVATRATQ